MTTRPFKIQVDQADEGIVVRMVGSCTMEYSDQVGRTLQEALDASDRALVVDISELDFIDSGGLGGLIEAYLRCRRMNRTFELASPQPKIKQMLALTRLTDLMPIRGAAPPTAGQRPS